MDTWTYFHRPTAMAFHDLTKTHKPPANLRSLLGLSLKFIPVPRKKTPWRHYADETLRKFDIDMRVKAYFAGQPSSDDAYNPKMYIRTDWTPPDWKYPFPKECAYRLAKFESKIKEMVTRRTKPPTMNLLPHQRQALRTLRRQDTFLVVQCDKNLGPAVIEKDRYIKMAIRDHLRDTRTYKRLSETEADQKEDYIRRQIQRWMKKHKKVLSRSERRFLQHHLDTNEFPFAVFYITMKVHKSPLKSRPIVSCSGSLLEGIGVWIDDKLKIAAREQPSYFKSSYDLKQELLSMDIPPNTYLFTADARAMYTNIPTDRALNFIGDYLRETAFPDVPVEALMSALRLVMKNNVFQFGDCVYLQKTGTAMGTPPAPGWATLYFALCENKVVPDFQENVYFYKRFIDDIIGLWTITNSHTQDANWKAFKTNINDPIFKLKWDFSPLQKTADFMDLTLSIVGNRIETTLYEKPHSLHLYIPPSSCHPPGLLPGVVHGCIHRFFTLCTNHADIKKKMNEFYLQLRRRGWQPYQLLPVFRKAAERAKTFVNHSTTNGPTPFEPDKMLFHIPYHPSNPTSSEFQHTWYNTISEPPYSKPLAEIKNYAGTPLELKQMIVSYSRAPNLSNILSYRQLKPNGPPVSSFLD